MRYFIKKKFYLVNIGFIVKIILMIFFVFEWMLEVLNFNRVCRI